MTTTDYSKTGQQNFFKSICVKIIIILKRYNDFSLLRSLIYLFS